MRKNVPYKVYLEEKELPESWYNFRADLSNLSPYLNPATHKPVAPDDMLAIFPMDLIQQEMSDERYIPIPEEVRELYHSFRPSPLCRAYGLEKLLDTPARIYYKYEGNNPSGSHKLNTAIPQAYYNKKAGIRRLATETGAGQWGTALSVAAQMFDMECTVYMVKVSYLQKPYRKAIMQAYGATVHPSPSPLTQAGKKILEKDPDSLGSLGIAISEAVEDAATHNDTNYALGSVLNHVLLHQTIIGLEARKQMEKIDEYPDVVVACCGGGSNFGGIAFPFLHDKIREGKKTEFIAVEPAACPTLTKGKFAYDFGDVAQMTPIMQMYTLGHGFIPPGIHAGGLRYHGDSVLVSKAYNDGLISARAVHQTDVFKAAIQFARSELILPAPESAHAIKGAIDEALKCKETGESKCILFCLSGHGNFDLTAYEEYMTGKLSDYEYPDELLAEGLETLPQI
ncbi:MAG: TrpB-like pyridoxal phosphate-dependent enzyme [Clostridiaceae bacterium]|nr:TrpB-like pyridoxal phosphate-dependent enzyme [Clostridiaceae bacterium]